MFTQWLAPEKNERKVLLAFKPARGNALDKDALADEEDHQHRHQNQQRNGHHVAEIGLAILAAKHVEATANT